MKTIIITKHKMSLSIKRNCPAKSSNKANS